MTQLMIDIAQETPDGLRLAAKFLSDHAALREAMERNDQSLALNTAPVPAGTSLPPVPPPPSNVIPLVPPAPLAATPIAPVAPPAPSALPVVSTSSAVVSPVTTTPGVLPTDAYDDTGMPHDLRIHQKGMSKKKDGSWKVQKGLDPALVIAVTQELQAAGRMRAPTNTSAQPNPATLFGQTPLPAGASAPVALPPGPQNAQIPPPPPQGDIIAQAQHQAYAQAVAQTQAQIPPPPPVSLPGGSTVPVPPPPGVGLPNAGQSNVVPIVSGFRALMDKLTRARTAGKLTAEQVNSAVQRAGAPSLQMLSSMSHLVPEVDALIDALLIVA